MNDLVQAISALAVPSQPSHGTLGVTSDLSVDEVLLLHSAGWEPAGVVFGVGWWSIPWGTWQWQVGEVEEAAAAFRGAFGEATEKMRSEASYVGGSGVVGVQVEIRVRSQHVDVGLTGSAIRPTGEGRTHSARHTGGSFLSDLSARDFIMLSRAGWVPLDLVAGASFVIAPRRSARQWASQQGRNAELTNLTQALYHAREVAMEGMQTGGTQAQAEGVVNVKLREGRLGYSSRIVQFVAVGTAVRLSPQGHQEISPTMVVPLDEKVRQFEATSLRSTGNGGKRRRRRH